MNKCIRLDCFQSTASYKKPMSIEVGESYRLPPYSTVIGFVHNACGFSDYHPMQVSIQGEYQTIISDTYTRNFMGIAYDETRHFYKVPNEKGGSDGVTRGLGYNELLVDVKLVLHILPEEKDFESVLNGLKNPLIYPSLGRYEDMMRIDKISVVEIAPTDTPNLYYDAYVPAEMLKNAESKISCSAYTLNKNYSVDPKMDCRMWNKVKAFHFVKGGNIILEQADAFAELESGIGVFLA